jgi:cobalt-zinc-cadmium efflux system outer membrane protein
MMCSVQATRGMLDAVRATLAVLALGACGASSPYDASWVSAEVGKSAGHAVPVRETGGQGTGDRFLPTLPPAVASTRSLSEDDAVSVALWNSAQFRADLAQLGFSRADLADAAAIPNPNLSLLFPMSTRQFELSALYPIAALFQRPWRVATAKYGVEKTARALVQSGLDAVRDVRIAWAELEASERRKNMRVRVDEIVRGSAALADLRHQNGDVSALEADLVKAESLAAAELAQRAGSEESVARAHLRLLLGLAESPLGEHLGVRAVEVPTDAPASLTELEKTALASRPDLRAAEIAIEMAGERTGLENARILQLLARLDAKPVGPGGSYPLVLQPGFTLEIPVFNQNPGGRARASAELERAAWSYLAMRQQVVTDVRLAQQELMMAIASREPWKTVIVPLQERNVAAATQAYEVGGEAYLVVLEATRRLVDAKLRELELGLDVRRARARLDRAVGWRIHAAH